MGELQDFVNEKASELKVPGVSVGVLNGDVEEYAFYGVTSVENPLDVNDETLFQFGSTGKTFTATMVMMLVEQGRFDLDTRVKDLVPELTLKDKTAEEQVTVLQLLNHTAGWSGDLIVSTGDGDDALEKYVALMADIDQVTPLGEAVSYNNASLSLAGRVIEKVTGKVFQDAAKEMLFEPLGLKHTFFYAGDIMTRRFAVGHELHPDGAITVSRPWPMPRSAAPAGGISANAADQIAWAKFHLGDGKAPDGTQLLSEKLLKMMQEPTVDMKGSALGDYVGISWLLRDIGDDRLVGHGGTTNGQYSEFLTVPAKSFALTSMTNCGPNGSEFNKALAKWALERYCGIADVEPEPITLGDAAKAEYVGTYETIAAEVQVVVEEGQLVIRTKIKPEMLKQLREEGHDAPEDSPAIPICILPGDDDRYVVVGGPAKGMKGYFKRDESGRVVGAHVGGRMASRVQ
ncbi:MAG: serine hydrolase domain-containing protein [Acidimicrobiia bacterium]